MALIHDDIAIDDHGRWILDIKWIPIEETQPNGLTGHTRPIAGIAAPKALKDLLAANIDASLVLPVTAGNVFSAKNACVE